MRSKNLGIVVSLLLMIIATGCSQQPGDWDSVAKTVPDDATFVGAINIDELKNNDSAIDGFNWAQSLITDDITHVVAIADDDNLVCTWPVTDPGKIDDIIDAWSDVTLGKEGLKAHGRYAQGKALIATTRQVWFVPYTKSLSDAITIISGLLDRAAKNDKSTSDTGTATSITNDIITKKPQVANGRLTIDDALFTVNVTKVAGTLSIDVQRHDENGAIVLLYSGLQPVKIANAQHTDAPVFIAGSFKQGALAALLSSLTDNLPITMRLGITTLLSKASGDIMFTMYPSGENAVWTLRIAYPPSLAQSLSKRIKELAGDYLSEIDLTSVGNDLVFTYIDKHNDLNLSPADDFASAINDKVCIFARVATVSEEILDEIKLTATADKAHITMSRRQAAALIRTILTQIADQHASSTDDDL